ncbi:MAG TPA: DUF3108 domain-containing protein [Ramlibacter sp.]|nr:DUF3108 domain-containing protein [Ramlibacter sp.]
MVGDESLTRASGRRLLVLLALVLLAHAWVLDWVARQLAPASILRSMPAPMLTRLLQPETPAPPAPPPPRPVARKPARPAVTSIAKQPEAPRPRPAASAAEAVAAVAESEQPAAPPVAEALPATEPPSAPVPPDIAMSAPAATETVAVTPEAPASEPAAASQGRDLDGWPVDTRLNYRLGGLFRHGELHGSARVQWQRQDQRYQTRVDIDVTLLVSLAMTSQGEVTPQGLKPEAYEELRRSGPRSARMGEDTIVLSDGRKVPKPQGVQDTASQFVELSHRFASGQEPLEVGRSVSFWMARPGGVDLWTYDIVGRDLLRTPGFGEVEAFHLKPRNITSPRGNITAEIWFAPSLQYLPVRIRVNMGEETYVDLMVDKIEQR